MLGFGTVLAGELSNCISYLLFAYLQKPPSMISHLHAWKVLSFTYGILCFGLSISQACLQQYFTQLPYLNLQSSHILLFVIHRLCSYPKEVYMSKLQLQTIQTSTLFEPDKNAFHPNILEKTNANSRQPASWLIVSEVFTHRQAAILSTSHNQPQNVLHILRRCGLFKGLKEHHKL